MARRQEWMARLARHYAAVRATHPGDRLLILFEADGVVDQAPALFDVIRWFQLQPDTYVGLTGALPPSGREATLQRLNELGRAHRVRFDGDLVLLAERHLDPVRAFERAGYRTFAVVGTADPPVGGPADVPADGTLFVGAAQFDLTALVGESTLPRQVDLVWHGLNDELNLRRFLASEVSWGECDIRRHPRGHLVLRHDPFPQGPPSPEADAGTLPLVTALEAFADHDRRIKLDLKEGGPVVDEVLGLLARYGFDDSHLWFNAPIEVLGADGFRRLRAAHPGAVVQCPVDFLAPLALATPGHARSVLGTLADWGITRWSVAWGRQHTRPLWDRLEAWRCEVNVYAVPDHHAFLQAVLLLPRSLTADFNFPSWNYFGRGSGELGRYHRYDVPAPVGVASGWAPEPAPSLP